MQEPLLQQPFSHTSPTRHFTSLYFCTFFLCCRHLARGWTPCVAGLYRACLRSRPRRCSCRSLLFLSMSAWTPRPTAIVDLQRRPFCRQHLPVCNTVLTNSSSPLVSHTISYSFLWLMPSSTVRATPRATGISTRPTRFSIQNTTPIQLFFRAGKPVHVVCHDLCSSHKAQLDLQPGPPSFPILAWSRCQACLEPSSLQCGSEMSFVKGEGRI